MKQFSTSIPRKEKSYAEFIENMHKNGIRFGQPTHISHPHLVKPNELAIGIQRNEFVNRRHRLIEKIHEQCIARDQTTRQNIVSQSNSQFCILF